MIALTHICTHTHVRTHTHTHRTEKSAKEQQDKPKDERDTQEICYGNTWATSSSTHPCRAEMGEAGQHEYKNIIPYTFLLWNIQILNSTHLKAIVWVAGL